MDINPKEKKLPDQEFAKNGIYDLTKISNEMKSKEESIYGIFSENMTPKER